MASLPSIAKNTAGLLALSELRLEETLLDGRVAAQTHEVVVKQMASVRCARAVQI
jgi:hypothetical protein